MSDVSQGPGWWQASDGKWYPPEQATQPPPTQPTPTTPAAPGAPSNPYGQQAPPYQPYQAQPSRKMNGLAIAALVCGILWGFGVLAIVAVVFGIIALKQIKTRGETGNGLAIAGIILGGIGILGAIVSIITLVAVSDEIDNIGETATVRIEASEDVCWTAALDSSDPDVDGTRERGCGSALLDLGEGIGREARVTNVSGPESIEVTAIVEGEVQDSATASEGETVTVEP
ncbi:MAG TPA: DUF4190 domain-containing protein [Acidimicrobiales bacterium]|nr:DUF4190 domain-containing protein [Acidimicrobiales bacterium]